MPAMVGGDYRCILGEGGGQIRYIFPAFLYCVHVLRTHPAVFVTHRIHIAQIDKGELHRRLFQKLSRGLRHHVVALLIAKIRALAEIGKGQRVRPGQVPQLLPVGEHGGGLPGGDGKAQVVEHRLAGVVTKAHPFQHDVLLRPALRQVVPGVRVLLRPIQEDAHILQGTLGAL